MKDVSPCITRSRYKGHWITNVQRRMSLEEMCRFQGFDPTKIKQSVSNVEMGRMLGNAMSINIVERILFRVLRHMGFVQLASTVDRWESGEAQRALRASKNNLLQHVVCDRDSLVREHTMPDKCAIAGQVVTRVIDSGASFHVMNPEEMTNQQRKKIYSIKPLQVSTANGRIAITKAADLWIDRLRCKLTFLVMPDAPCLISSDLCGKMMCKDLYPTFCFYLSDKIRVLISPQAFLFVS